jgi:hypothetical protein
MVKLGGNLGRRYAIHLMLFDEFFYVCIITLSVWANINNLTGSYMYGFSPNVKVP